MPRGRLTLLLNALVRVSTYVNNEKELSAGAAIDQLKSALAGNVLYVDGGWQTIVDGLRTLATARGAAVLTSSRATAVAADPSGLRLSLAKATRSRRAQVILAVDPRGACELLDLSEDDPLARCAANQLPVHAACLDVALSRLPHPEERFALGLDHPYYFSVHSAAAKLAPAGVAVLHVMKYLPEEAKDSTAGVESELATFLDVVQPGWKANVLAQRFLPRMVVTQALPQARRGGLSGRQPVSVAGRPGVLWPAIGWFRRNAGRRRCSERTASCGTIACAPGSAHSHKPRAADVRLDVTAAGRE